MLATDVRDALAVRRAAPAHRRRRGGRAAHRRDARPRRRRSARAARHRSAASSGSSARSRRSSSRTIYRLGIPGIGFLTENKRVYPNGAEVSHVIGHVNIDNQGIAGIEKWLDGNGLAGAAPGRARHRPAAEAGRARRSICACSTRCATSWSRRATSSRRKAAAGLVTRRAHRRDRRDGVGAGLRPEQSARGARPDPHQPADHRRLRDGLDLQGAHARDGARFRQGHAQLDASTRACRCATASSTSTTIHAQNRVLTRAGGLHLFVEHRRRARWRSRIGVERHKAFLRKLGQLDRLRTELPESAEPIVPKRWGELNTITIAFGHGLSVAPLQAVMAIGALMNGGMLIPPTFLKRTRGRGDGARQARDQARDQRDDALSDAAQRREGHRQEGRRARATMSAARPAPPKRWSTAAIPRPRC